MTDAQILNLLSNALGQVAPKAAAKHPELRLDMTIKELGIDSVALMEMVGVIEEEVGLQFPDDELAQVSKLGDFAQFIRKAGS